MGMSSAWWGMLDVSVWFFGFAACSRRMRDHALPIRLLGKERGKGEEDFWGRMGVALFVERIL